MADENNPHRSVLQNIADRTGVEPKVLLPDSGSDHGASPVVTSSASAKELLPQGRGNYQMLGQIARGGMSVILKGHDTDLGRDVAVKVLDADLAQRGEVVQRFVEEAQIGGQLQHPGIVPVYELGLMADDRPYFAMKLVKGRTLASLFQQRKDPSEDRGKLLQIFESVCQTVAYAHSKGVVHRDLKPANIMVGAFGEVQVVDWGLAKVLGQGGVDDEIRAQESQASIHSIIETIRSGPGSVGSDSMVGSVMGTPAYMPPEQAQGEVEKLDERADVFALGAILCELLTGGPPYLETEEDPVIVQAARAELDGARGRVEASGADPALIRLCLDCLMPARAARPANADAVATAVHEFLATSEDRAHRAEVAAAEARVKAVEERRARRLTALLGLVVALALVGGAFAYTSIERGRAERVEQTRRVVDEAQAEANRLRDRGQLDDALQSARRGLALAQSGAHDPALLTRAEQFVAQLEDDVAAADAERLQLERDAALRDRLIELRVAVVESIGDRTIERRQYEEYGRAFSDYGLDLDAADLVPALEKIRERGLAEPVALALDDWSRLRRLVGGGSREEAENVFYLALDLDPDPVRTRMREAIRERDLDAMLELARPETIRELPPSSIFVLGTAIWTGFPDRRDVVYRIYDQALPLHPDDFVLQSVGGMIYNRIGDAGRSLEARYAALARRPGDVNAMVGMAESYLFQGRLPECESTARAVIAADGESFDGHFLLAMAQVQLGDHLDALRNLERAVDIGGSDDASSDVLFSRYILGDAERDELIEAMGASFDPVYVSTVAMALLDHPEPSKRDPASVLEVLDQKGWTDEEGFLAGDINWMFVLRARAYMELEEWEAARQELEGRYTLPTLALYVPPVMTFLRAIVEAGCGHDEVAREHYARGLAEAEELMRSNRTAWGRSDLVRWRDAAAAVVGG